MRKIAPIYCRPGSSRPLRLEADEIRGDQVLSGRFMDEDGGSFPIENGIPSFITILTPAQQEAMDYYDDAAKVYDDVANLSFDIQCCDEETTRRSFISLLELAPGYKVLELACGTGRDSVNIAAALDGQGHFFLQDISRNMLARCRSRLEGMQVPMDFSVGNACALPFPDDYFDAVFSFGGLGVFGDIRGSLKEMTRVARPGAKIVVGDESLAPWLYGSEYGAILLNNNPLFKAELPLKELPVEARDVRVQWVVGGVYYLIDFRVGEGEPPANFDLPIPGARGGTLRTRYYGKLEGVSTRVLEKVRQARARSGLSMHDWLDKVLAEAADKELDV